MSLSEIELLQMQAYAIEELLRRNVVQTQNAPLGDYAEWLFCETFGWERESNSTKAYDAKCKNRGRVQIKARRLSTQNASRQLGALRELDRNTFDVLAAVLFASDFSVQRAALIPRSIAFEHAKFRERTNSWRFILNDMVWNYPNVIDVTSKLQSSQTSLL
jgi:hypothetical protein